MWDTTSQRAAFEGMRYHIMTFARCGSMLIRNVIVSDARYRVDQVAWICWLVTMVTQPTFFLNLRPEQKGDGIFKGVFITKKIEAFYVQFSISVKFVFEGPKACWGWQQENLSSSLLAFCERNPLATSGFLSQRSTDAISWRHRVW